MRLLRLDLEAYGAFARETLHFRADADVHVVIGPNESGKSTRRAAIVDLLYDIPHQSAYAFKHGKSSRVAARIAHDGDLFEVVRRKGRGQTLLTPAGEPLAAARLAGWTAGLDREAYARLFSLSQGELVAGAGLLLADAGSVASALYGAATGGFDVRAALRSLDEERNRIFTSKGKNPTLNAAIIALEAARDRRTRSALPPNAWHERRAQIGELDARIAAAASTVQSLRARAAELRPLIAAAPDVERLRNHVFTLAATSAERVVPRDRLTEIAAVLDGLAADRARLAALDEEIATQRDARERLRADPALLAAAPHVAMLQQGLGTVRQAERDLEGPDGLLLKRAETLHAIEATRPLLWPNASPEELRLKRALLERLPELRGLLGAHAKVESTRRAASERLARVTAQAAREEAALAELGTPLKLGPLDAALADLETGTRADLAREETEARIAALADTVVIEVRALGFDFEDPLEIRTRCLPLRADGADFAARVQALEDEKTLVRDALAAATEAVLDRRARLEPLEAAGLADAGDRLQRLRDDRDAHLESVLRAVHDRAPEAASRTAEYRRDVTAADAYADRRFDRAEDVAAAAFHRTELLREEHRAAEARERAEEHARRRDGLLAEWTALRASLSPTIRRPAALLEWLDRAYAAVARASELATLRHEADALRLREGELRATLRAAWPALATDAPSFGALVLEARRARQLAADRDAKRGAVQVQIVERRRELATARDDDAKACAASAAWSERWEAAVASLGLPALADPASAEGTLATIEALLRALDAHAALEERIRGIEGRRAAFVARAETVVRDASPELEIAFGRDPLDAVDRLCASIHDAIGARREIDGRLLALERDEAKRAERAEAVRVAESALAAFAAELGTPVSAVGDALAAGTARAALEAASEQIARDIRLATGCEPEAVQRTLDELGGEPGVRAEVERIHADLRASTEARDALVAERGVAAESLDRAENSTEAHGAHVEIAAIGAEIDREARRYAALTVAATVLAERMEAYAADHQGPVLRSASAFLARLTGDRYVRVAVGEDEAFEIVEAAGGLKSVEALSEGTQDQLYLALRLATLEERLGAGGGPPLLLDDAFKNFDDRRTVAAFRALSALAPRVQIVYFTPRTIVGALAREALGERAECLELAAAGSEDARAPELFAAPV